MQTKTQHWFPLFFLILTACQHKGQTTTSTVSIQRHGLTHEVITEGSVTERQSLQHADLAIFYAGEHQGNMETCGCPKRPRGSLPRLVSQVKGHQEHHPQTATLLVHGGWWLSDAMGTDGELRADVPVMNKHLIRGIEAASFDAVNVAYLDLPGLNGHQPPPWAVSANVKPNNPDQAPVLESLLIEKNDLVIGVTGITKVDESFSPSPGFRIEDPVEAAVKVLKALEQKADLLVLLTYDTPAEIKSIVEKVPGLDVIIDTRQNRIETPPIQIGESIWVKSHYQTMRLGELRLQLGDDKQSTNLVVDRKIDLDSEIPDDPSLYEMMNEARSEINAIQSDLFGLSE